MERIPEVPVHKFLVSALEILKNPLPFHRRVFKEKGNTFRLNFGFGESVVFSRDAQFAQHVLQKNQKNYSKSPIQTRDLSKYVGKGLLTSEGKLWAKQRKLIQPAFHKKHLAQLIAKMNEVVISELEKIKTDVSFDIFPIYNDLAFQTVVQALFSGAADQKTISRLQQVTEEAQAMLVKELRQPYLGWWFKISGTLKANLTKTQEARKLLESLVAERKASGIRHDDLLDMLLDARYEDQTKMDKEQLIDEIFILFIAGHETTSNALTFTTQLLARHPEIQQKVYEEVTACEADDLFFKLKALSYTNLVINEAMRLYPPAYFIDRIALEADSFHGFEIEKDTSLLFSVYEIHRNPEFWKDPETFNPSRFEDEKLLKYSPYFLPFGAGPRMCIGNNFAMYEMILAIMQLVRRFEITSSGKEIEILPLITLKPKNAILQFKRRKS